MGFVGLEANWAGVQLWPGRANQWWLLSNRWTHTNASPLTHLDDGTSRMMFLLVVHQWNSSLCSSCVRWFTSCQLFVVFLCVIVCPLVPSGVSCPLCQFSLLASQGLWILPVVFLDLSTCFWSFLLLATFHDSILIRIYWSHSGFVDLWVKSVPSFLNASLLDIIPAFEQKKYLIDTLGVIWQDLEYLFKFICYLMSNLKQECTSNQTHMKMSPNYCNILCISRWTKEGMKKFSWSCFGRLDFENKDEKSAT